MSYNRQDSFHQRTYAQPQQDPIQHNGFIDPQQLVKPAARGYVPPAANYGVANGGPRHSGVLGQQPVNTTQPYVAIEQQPFHSSYSRPDPAPVVQVPALYRNNAPQGQHHLPYPPTYAPPQTIPYQPPYPAQISTSDPMKVAQPEAPLDYRSILISLAEEYFSAAWKLGAAPKTIGDEQDMQEYYKLLATGLGCLEAVLKKFKHSPDVEATLRLRYASILYEETDNVMEAEEILSKGISLCDRHRFDDTKYNMQHVLIRLLFRKNHRAAFKYLERTLADAQAYQHIAWVYVFRFLRVSLHLDLGSRQDTNSALGQLRAIASLASEQGHRSIVATATTMEALVCLRCATDLEGFEQAQRALASVRSLQLDPNVGQNRRLTALTAFADISCHLQRLDPEQALATDRNLRQALDDLIKFEEHGNESTLAIPLENTTVSPSGHCNGVLRRAEDGSGVLVLKWIPKDDIYNLGYLLSGIAMVHKNTSDGRKSERMFQEGVDQQAVAEQASINIRKSIILSTSEQIWREQMIYYNRLHLAFTLAARTNWKAAKNHVVELKKLYNGWPDVPDNIFLMTQYLKATIAQGNGDLSTALALYETIIESTNGTLSTQNNTSQAHTAPVSTKATSSLLHRELHTLSTLNKLLIVRSPAHVAHNESTALLSDLASYCTSTRNPNRSITCAYHLLNSVLPSSHPSTILATKNSLHSALQTTKMTSNNQLMCIVLNIMSWKFFSGVVGEQAEKSARASQSLAKKGGDMLWMCTAAGVLAKTLEAAGKVDEAEAWRRNARECTKELPAKIRDFAETNGTG